MVNIEYKAVLCFMAYFGVCLGRQDRASNWNALLAQNEVSHFHQICCNPSNNGKTYQYEGNNICKLILCPAIVPSSCSEFRSCSDLHRINPYAPSGYYNILTGEGDIIILYCNMDGSYCDGEGGWMRVAYLNMSEPGSTCPIELQEYDYINIDHNVCDRPLGSASQGCDSLFFSPKGFNYRKVCGRVKAYQFGHLDAFYTSIDDIDSYYVDGISITYGNNPRRHIWTYACGEDDFEASRDDCPCNIGSSQTTP